MKIRDRIKELRRVLAKDLIPNPRNWRTHPKQQADALRGVLADVGYADALIARETEHGLMLLDGHLRAETTPDQEVPVLVLDVNEEEGDKILATLDPLSAMARADEDILKSLLKTVESENDEVKKLLERVAREEHIILDEPNAPGAGGDEFDTTPNEAETRVKSGDLWKLGEHRLICGDAGDKYVVAKLMNGRRAGLCFTSPPYAELRDYGKTYDEKKSDWFAMMASVFAELPMEEDAQIIVNLGPTHKEGEVNLYWDPWLHHMRILGWKLFGWYVWDKLHALPGDWNGRLAPSHEFFFHFNKTPVHPQHFVEKQESSIRYGGTHNFRQVDGSLKGMNSPSASLNDFKIPDSVIRMTRAATGNKIESIHPAVFPVGLPSFFMEAWPSKVCYEPFAGSGTQIIAAERMGCLCFAIEIEPKYCDVVLRRWEAETGKQAELLDRL